MIHWSLLSNRCPATYSVRGSVIVLDALLIWIVPPPWSHVFICQTTLCFWAITSRSLHQLPILSLSAWGPKERNDAPPPPPTSRRTGGAPGWDRLPAPVREELVCQDFQIWIGRGQFDRYASALQHVSKPTGFVRYIGKCLLSTWDPFKVRRSAHTIKS